MEPIPTNTTIPAHQRQRKINIGSGQDWRSEGWEILDNVPGDYQPWWKNKGKCWATQLPDATYGVVFTSHMLEHVPHFRTEKTISEFNRILKIGGILRILVPDLKRAAVAYVNDDKSFYQMSRHYTDHLGIGGSFMSKLISPGRQTLAISREMDEILGGYAHLYHFDFDMIRILLQKWGFEDVKEMPYNNSQDPDIQNNPLHLNCDSKEYSLKDQFVKGKQYLNSGNNWHLSGFDKAPEVSLIIEATKTRDEPYLFEKEYAFFQRSRFETRLDTIKLTTLRLIFRIYDGVYIFVKKIGLIGLWRR